MPVFARDAAIWLCEGGDKDMSRCTVLWLVCPDGHEVLVRAGYWAWCPDCCYLEERQERRGEPCGRPVACRVEEDGGADDYCRGHGLHFMQQFDDAQLVSLAE